MDKLSEQYYNELCDLEYWQKSYDRIVQTNKYSTDTIETVFSYMQTGKYKKIAKQLAKGTYVFSTPEKILIAKTGSTKKRVIYCYAEIDRFLMSLLYRVTSKIFADKISERCFSYKQGVNTRDALNGIKTARVMYGVKADIHAYFNSVSREHLYKCLDELFGDAEGIRKTFDKLYRNDDVLIKGELKKEYKSLIPGSALGSFFANYCLRDVDKHFEELGITYARYSDDIILFDKTEEAVQEHIKWLLKYIEGLGLTINEDKYKYFNPDEPVDYLGLKFESSESIDISDHAKQKIKKTIKRWCRKGRKEIEMQGKSFEPVAKNIIKRLNNRLYKTYIEDTTKFGWAYYAFRYITDPKSLKELDDYCKDTIRALKTGRHNKKNKYAITEEEFNDLNYVSFIEMYELFHTDFGYYCDVVARL